MSNPTKEQLFKLVDEVKASNPLDTSIKFFGTQETIDYAKEHNWFPESIETVVIPDYIATDEYKNKLFIIPIEEIKPIKFICED